MPSRRSVLTAAGAALALAALPRAAAAGLGQASGDLQKRLLPSTPLDDGDFVPAPEAWLRMIERFPQFHPGDSVPAKAASTAGREAELVHVQQLVNSTVIFRPDPVEFWQPADTEGDCEDFALRKLQILIEDFGWPRGALTIAVGRVETGQAHAVLLAHMERGVYALDNRLAPVLPWRALNCRWKAREEAGAPFLLWRQIAA